MKWWYLQINDFWNLKYYKRIRNIILKITPQPALCPSSVSGVVFAMGLSSLQSHPQSQALLPAHHVNFLFPISDWKQLLSGALATWYQEQTWSKGGKLCQESRFLFFLPVPVSGNVILCVDLNPKSLVRIDLWMSLIAPFAEYRLIHSIWTRQMGACKSLKLRFWPWLNICDNILRYKITGSSFIYHSTKHVGILTF